MNRSTGESVKRSRSRPGNSLDGMAGAAAAALMPAASRRPTIEGQLVMRVLVLRPRPASSNLLAKQMDPRVKPATEMSPTDRNTL